MTFRFGLAVVIGMGWLGDSQAQDSQAVGMFEGHADVGGVLHPGSAEFDANTKTYTLTGSGDNIWSVKDEFQFVWKKVSADDLTLTAAVSILGAGGNEHRKAVLMVRQSLDGDSAYVDAARHGEGLTSLQFREKKGAVTHEIESNVSGPARLRLEKRGDRFYLWIAPTANGELEFAGGSAWVEMRPPFYVGIGICAHAKDAIEKAVFSDVELDTAPRRMKGKGKFSTVETVLLSGDARTGYLSKKHLRLPGWTADGSALTFEGDNLGEVPFTPLRTASPVGAPVAAQTGSKFSYFASKNGNTMQIWRKSSDGSQSVQFTPDDFSNTAPHVSPDGKYLLFLSYSKEYNRIADYQPLELRLMSLSDNSIRTLATFIGGPESLGEQPWSPDGKRIVFVSYQSMK